MSQNRFVSELVCLRTDMSQTEMPEGQNVDDPKYQSVNSKCIEVEMYPDRNE